MHPILFEIPGIHLKLHAFGLLLCLAFFAAIALGIWRARRESLNPDWVYDIGLWALFGGLIGARLFYVVQYWGQGRIRSFFDIFKIWEGGIVFYGGLAGGLAACLAFALIKKLPILPLLDLSAPSLALGLAIGRLGCFMNGCCYGDPANLPWAVSFPPGSSAWWDHVNESAAHPENPLLPGLTREHVDAARSDRILENTPWSAPVHPTQLYSSIDGFLLLAVLSAFYPLRRRDGQVMALFLVLYPLSRTLIEELRGDEGAFLLGMTISQTTSLLIFATGVALFLFVQQRPERSAAQETGT